MDKSEQFWVSLSVMFMGKREFSSLGQEFRQRQFGNGRVETLEAEPIC
jgi:hypothetical protein